MIVAIVREYKKPLSQFKGLHRFPSGNVRTPIIAWARLFNYGTAVLEQLSTCLSGSGLTSFE
jgi:hypothetical protein